MKEENLEIDTRVVVWVPPELKKQLKVASAKEGLSMWRYIAMLHNNRKIYNEKK